MVKASSRNPFHFLGRFNKLFRRRKMSKGFYINLNVDSKEAYDILKEHLDIDSIVIEVRMEDPSINDRVGFVIVNENAIYYTGAGFRGDGVGEGGHYYSKALKLIDELGAEKEEPIVFEEDADLKPNFLDRLRLAIEDRKFWFDYTVPIGG